MSRGDSKPPLEVHRDLQSLPVDIRTLAAGYRTREAPDLSYTPLSFERV